MIRSGKGESDEMETESKWTGMDTSFRRSERMRRLPKRLEYAEFGKPLVTVVKSFFHRLTTALADALSEEENCLYHSVPPGHIKHV